MSKSENFRAVFFDKDGTLIRDVPYNVRPELIELAPGATEAVKRLKQAGFKTFIISNQSGVARGFFKTEDLKAVWARINELCQTEFDGFYFCPHFEHGAIEKYSFDCDCRKPKPGLILQAAREHNLDLQSSWFIGDSFKDVEAGRRAGCQTILIGESKQTSDDFGKPHFTATNLIEAANIILRQPD